jgi:hypothetical protein
MQVSVRGDGRSMAKHGRVHCRGTRPRSLALLLSFALFMTGCRSSDRNLAALKSDPMASVQIAGTTPGRVFTTHQGKALGMPVHAQILRPLNSNSGVVSQQMLDTAAERAREAGWSLTRSVNGAYRGNKTVDRVRISLTIVANHDVQPEHLLIALDSVV